MDLKDFKLLKEDDHHYKIQHPKGKVLHVEKQKLNEKAHGLIKKLACGGEVKKMSDGGDVTTPEDERPFFDKVMSPPVQGVNVPGEIHDYLSTTPIYDFASKVVNPPTEEQGLEPAKQETVMQSQPPPPEHPVSEGTPAIAYQAPGTGNLYMKGMQQQIAGQQELATAAAKETESTIKSIDQLQAQMPTKTPLDWAQEWHNSNQKLEKAIEGQQLDPYRLYHNMDTGDKVMSAIGLMLSGFGAGLTKQAPFAMQLLNSAIEKDIHAQKFEMEKNVSLWKMNREALKTDMEADMVTRNQLYTAAKTQLMKSAAQAKSDVAHANMLTNIGVLNQQIGMRNMMLGYAGALHGTGGLGTEEEVNQLLTGSSVMAPDVYKEAKERYLPGIGMTSAVNARPEDRTALLKLTDYANLLKRAQKFQSDMGLMGAITPKHRAEAESLTRQLQLESNGLSGLNRMSDTDLSLVEKMTGKLGNLNLGGTKELIDQLIKSTDEKIGTLKKSLNVVPFKGSSGNINQPANEVERKDPKTGRTVIYDAKTQKPLRWK